MRKLVRNLLPYGLVVRLAVKAERARRDALAAERARSLRDVNGSAVKLERLPRLNMGCGTHNEPGWWNVDGQAEAADIRLWLDDDTVLPFESGSLDVVFSEHFIEHVPFSVGVRFCHEAARVLRPGGVFRCSTPDFNWVVNASGSEDWKGLARIYEEIGDFTVGALRHPSHVINWTFHGHGHQYLWSFADFEEQLTLAGFSDVKRVNFGETSFAGAAIETRQSEQFYSIVVEATRR
jgi:SAM-dependent methyltransferase